MIRADDLIGDVRRAGAWDWRFYTARLNGPVDRADWSMTPQTNDAYNGSLRDIVFPAGILQPPMFDPAADPAVNYGAIGGVIGHELTHGFDDEGRKLDASGELRDWWTPADAAAFQARAKRLADQYSTYEPVPGAHINGELTLGENIADLGGVNVALEAYHRSLSGRPAPVIDGLHRRSAGAAWLGAGLAGQGAGGLHPKAGGERPALTAGLPDYRSYPQRGRLVRRFRCEAG